MSLVCNVRDDGYALVFKMKDIKVDLLRQLRNHQEQHVEVLRQMNQIIKEEEYVRLIVEGNPISKPYLATDISLETRELLVIFDPRIINIITTFCKF